MTDTTALKKEIRVREIKLGIRSLEMTIERFELDLLKVNLEKNRLEDELERSRTALTDRQNEFETLLKEN